MDLNETQESSLQLVFHFADKNDLELIDLKDLRAVIQFLTSAEGKDELEELGGLSKATAGVILRELITLEAQGMEKFFGEPEFDTAELLRTAPDGRGVVSCLELPTLQTKPDAVLDVPHVAARRPVRGPARGRGPRQAQARVLPGAMLIVGAMTFAANVAWSQQPASDFHVVTLGTGQPAPGDEAVRPCYTRPGWRRNVAV